VLTCTNFESVGVLIILSSRASHLSRTLPDCLFSGRIKVKNKLTHIQTTTRTQTFGAINITSIRKALTSQAQWQVVYNQQRI
jgi:hypothetical protein